MRRSSRGNPYHDEKGRFTNPNRYAVKTNEKDYDEQTKERSKKDIEFEVKTPIGEKVKYDRSSFYHCKTHKHDLMLAKKNRQAVKDVLKNPKEITQSGKRKDVYIYYGKSEKATFGDRMYIKVIVQTKKGDSRVVSTWCIKKITKQEGEITVYEKDD